MRVTKRFHGARVQTLSRIFDRDRLINIWRNNVKNQIRSLDILDLHDYYDFNVNIVEQAKRIGEEIQSGSYKASHPLVFRLEKKLGICRHMSLPSPSDCLVLQALTDFVSNDLLESAPHKDRAFYTRQKHSKKNPESLGKIDPYSTGEKWKEFQNEILGFKDDFKFVVTTDIANYYDNIGLRELRNVVSSSAKTDEVVWDLLFQIIEQLTWTPDYLPKSFRGLPTVNLEPIRLLAHVLLFELDQFLGKKTDANFVRWMDDVNFGVASYADACRILGDANDLLKSRGLALNLQKTEIMESETLPEALLRDQHDWLDEVQKEQTPGADEVLGRFNAHLEQNKARRGNDKVTKRYLTLASKRKFTNFLEPVVGLYSKHPAFRASICSYLRSLPVTDELIASLGRLRDETNFYDDVSLFSLIKLSTDINLPRTEAAVKFIHDTQRFLTKRKSHFDFYCFLWFGAKYSTPKFLYEHIYKLENWWIRDAFLSRQVVPVLSRIKPYSRDRVEELLDVILRSGHADASAVVHNLSTIRKGGVASFALNAYLFHKTSVYPLQKFLILYDILSSENDDLKTKVRTKLFGTLNNDEWMSHWIRQYQLQGDTADAGDLNAIGTG